MLLLQMRRMGYAILCGIIVLSATRALRADDPPAKPPRQLALLVGCTEYPNNPAIPELYGPGNDIPAWSKCLTDPKGFAFPADDVTVLLGWPQDPAKRPTKANIARAFAALTVKAGPNDRVFIVFSGHGTQVPIPADQDPFDPKNFEPDGLDEVFLPADAKDGDNGLENIIKDDEIGLWLDTLRAKGAHVLIVFDCCHSGTMTRGDDVERPRMVRAQALGIKNEQIAEAVGRANNARKAAKEAGRDIEAEAQKAAAGKTGDGSVVAFYAAQPFETAPELPLPEGSPQSKDHYFGLLSYTLLQTLEQRQGPISYHDFARIVAARYRAIRGTRSPTPFCEGDLDREFLGIRQWPTKADLVFERDGDKLRIGAGQLFGLTPGSVLAVRPPAGTVAGAAADEILGYVRVASASPTTANVKPTAFAGKAAAKAETFPDLGRCELVSRDFGDMRVKLFAADPAIVVSLSTEVREMLHGVAEGDAEWALKTFTAAQAVKEFGLEGLSGDHVLLYQGQGRKLAPKTATESAATDNADIPRKVYAAYPVGDPKALASALDRDLPKVFKWQNVWRVAGNVTMQNGETHGLRFEAALLKDEDDRSGGEPLRVPVLRHGQDMEFRVKNEGTEDLWVTMLYLDANLGVEKYWAGALRQGTALSPFRTVMTVKNNSTGLEGIVLMAIPMSVQKVEPNFAFLEQQPLRVPESIKRDISQSPSTPFGKLMSAAAFNGGTREMERRVPTTPAIVSQSWILLNAK